MTYLNNERGLTVEDKIRPAIRRVDRFTGEIFGVASAEKSFNSQVEKLRRRSGRQLIPPQISYHELPFGKIDGYIGELKILFRHLIPGLLSVLTKKSHWVTGPLELAPLGFWAVGDLVGLIRAGLILGYPGRRREVLLKVITAVTPIVPTALAHAVIDKYFAERYINYGTKAVRVWYSQTKPIAKEFLGEINSRKRSILR